MIATIIIFPFVILAAGIWAVIGLFFWIPLLAKSVTIFTFSVLANAIAARPAAASVTNLERAILYYITGFKVILNTLDIDARRGEATEEAVSISEGFISSIFFNLLKILQMVLFASIFWLMLFIFLNHLGILHIQKISDWERWLFSGRHQTLAEATAPKPPAPGQRIETGSNVTSNPTAATKMPQSDLQALITRLAQLWSPPAGAKDPNELVVKIRIQLKQDGKLAGPPMVLTSGTSPLFVTSRDSAISAVFRGQPYDMLKPEHYEQWKDIEITFDPRDMVRR